MSDNTRLNPGASGDAIRNIDKGLGVKTQVVVLDLGGAGVESLLTGANPLPVTGPLTNAQLRATPVPVSGGLTAAELRAESVPVAFDASFVSPFGDLNTAEVEAQLQLDFIYGINTQKGTSAVSTTGVVDTNLGRLRVQTGIGAAGSGLFTSRKPVKYRPGQGTIARFTPVFTAGVANSTQVIGMGSSTDGYFFGYNGTVFGVLWKNKSVETWIPQSTWNGDKCDGTGASGQTWNPTFGNVCMIKYPYLGYGNITFWVLDTNTSAWILCHTIKYTNTSASTQLGNPNLFFYAQGLNTGNTTNLTMYVGSVGVFTSGSRGFASSPKWAAGNHKAAITAETSLLGLRNCTVFNGEVNEGLIRLNSVTFTSSTTTKVAAAGFLRLRIGATLGGTPSYAPINGSTADNGATITSGNSIASIDTAATTAADGTYIFALSVNDAGNALLDLTEYEVFIAPGEILTLSGFGTAALFLSVTVTWTEDQ